MKNLHWGILGPALVLVSFGCVTLFSIAPSLLFHQIFFGVLGVILFLFLRRTDYRIFKLFDKFFYLIAIVVLAGLFLFAPKVRGTVRWFDIGSFKVQPSEFVKPLLTVFFASVLSSLRDFSLKNFLFLSCLIFLPMILVIKQPDLGMALVLLLFWLGMLFAAGFPFKTLTFFLLPCLVCFPYLWRFLKEYQKTRLITFLHPNLDPLGDGYNAIQAQIAVGSGWVFGKGLGFGTQSHLKFLPEQHSDFIFATLAEEAGFLGSLIVIGAFFILLVRILAVARKAPDAFGCLLCLGAFLQILTQVCVNIGMNIGLVPITGITLPMVSYGGSSLVSTFISLGIVASVAKKQKLSAVIDIR